MKDLVVTARTNAEFLNKVFGTHHKQLRKCTWPYSRNTIVWMVPFTGETAGYQNRLLEDGRIVEFYTQDDQDRINQDPPRYKHDYRLAVAVEKSYGYKRYRILGLYKINRDDMVERKVYFDPVPLETAKEIIPEAFSIEAE